MSCMMDNCPGASSRQGNRVRKKSGLTMICKIKSPKQKLQTTPPLLSGVTKPGTVASQLDKAKDATQWRFCVESGEGKKKRRLVDVFQQHQSLTSSSQCSIYRACLRVLPQLVSPAPQALGCSS